MQPKMYASCGSQINLLFISYMFLSWSSLGENILDNTGRNSGLYMHLNYNNNSKNISLCEFKNVYL
jgi:hypothetical protein